MPPHLLSASSRDTDIEPMSTMARQPQMTNISPAANMAGRLGFG